LFRSNLSSRAGDNGHEDGQQLTGFAVEPDDLFGLDATFFLKQFNPKSRFVGFLKQPVKFGAELEVGTRAGGFTGMGGHGGARAQELMSEHFHFPALMRQGDIQADDARRILLGSLAKFFGEAAHVIKQGKQEKSASVRVVWLFQQISFSEFQPF
jgi:hypothetical protein